MTPIFYALIIISGVTGERFYVGKFPNLDECTRAEVRWKAQAENVDIRTICKPRLP